MHTPEGSKHKLEESFLIEIYEVKEFAIIYGEEEQCKHDILMLKHQLLARCSWIVQQQP
jgi:hypothetical protein